MSSSNVTTTDQYRVSLVKRDKPAGALAHPGNTELLYIVEGAGAVVTGGTLVPAANGKPASIANGVTQKVVKGDVVIVPAGSAHWFSVVDSPITYLEVRWVAPASLTLRQTARSGRIAGCPSQTSGPSSPKPSRVSATRRPSRSSAPDRVERFTYRQLHDMASAWASWLAQQGIAAGRSLRHPRAQRRALVRGLSRHPEARRRRRSARHELFGRAGRDHRPRFRREAAVRQREIQADGARQRRADLSTCTLNQVNRPWNPLNRLNPLNRQRQR